MAFWDQEELITTIDKNSLEKIEIKHCKRDGKEYIDIRTCYLDKESDTWKPTSKGVVIPADKFKIISDAVLNEPKDTAE